MNLKTRQAQLKNRIEELEETRLYPENQEFHTQLEMSLKLHKLKERKNELDFLLGDIEKDIKV